MIIGVSGLAIALVVGGLALFAALRVAVDRTLDTEARATAEQVAAMVAEDRLPAPIPVSGAQLIQVVDGEGRVIGGSLLADRLTPLLRSDELSRALAGSAVEVSGARAGLDGPLRVVAAPGGRPGVSVIVASQVGDVVASQRTLRNALLILFPLLLGLLGVIAYVVIGWTLRPVEQLRRGAERISGGGADERLPVPQAADEIRALAVTLNTMLDRLAAGRERQRSFVADAAHELRSPLTSMRTQLEVAQHLGEGGALTDDLLADVKRLSVLVEDLLLLARADADQRPPAVPETVELRSLLADVASSITEPRVPVRVVGGEPVLADADREELRRALANLVDNAVRHARSEVELNVAAADGAVRIGVSDDGPGIDPADRERVFDRFTRLDDARGRDGGGSGLGLAIVRQLVDRSGGSVRFVDGSGRWSLRAEIVLPLPEPDARRGVGEPRSAPMVTTPTGATPIVTRQRRSEGRGP
ncbi:MAG TPA: HAMP domain-containing sensor histidine kinase [Microlunatus sp.]